jgi:hypothetical protein
LLKALERKLLGVGRRSYLFDRSASCRTRPSHSLRNWPDL